MDKKSSKINSDITSKLEECIQDFNKKISIVVPIKESGIRYLDGKSGYNFSQSETLNDIELATLSKFKTGDIDEEGQQKLYMNTVNFVTDVARKNVDLDVRNFIFRPVTRSQKIMTILMSKSFSMWAKKAGFGEIINELVDDFPKYGTAVLKKVGKTVERVPLRTLINSQDAKSLKDAVLSGGYVIQTHQLSYEQVKAFPNWVCDDFDGKKDFYEMYTYLELSTIREVSGGVEESETNEDKSKVLSVTIINKETNEVLYCEQVDELPYEDVFWNKIDGRWLGVGEVESQFENQKAMNLVANLQKRGMLWSSKKVFQTQGEAVSRNLIKQVRDGDVLEVGLNGAITQINNQTQASGDYAQARDMWSENSKQKSFTFEVSTGESMPSATPFRLGVILSEAAASHFERKREKLGLFLQRGFFNLIVPIFIKECEDHTLYISKDQDGFMDVRDAMIQFYVNDYYWKLLSGDLEDIPDELAVREKVIASMPKDFYFSVLKKEYKDVEAVLDLDITGEATDNKGLVDSYTTVYQQLLAKGDPRADEVLDEIMSLSGVRLSSAKPVSQSATSPIMSNQQATTPNLTPTGIPSLTPA